MTTKAKDLQDYKTAFPKSRQKKKGYTKKFQKWMRQRVKAGTSDDLWTEPATVYNEETKRFISTKSKKFFDGRTKKTIKLKKNIAKTYFLQGSRLIKDVKGVANFQITYKVQRKNPKTGKLYKETQNVTKSLTINAKKSNIKEMIKEAIEAETGRAELDSNLFLIGEQPQPVDMSFMSLSTPAVSLMQTFMKYNGMVDLDGETENAEWCKDRGMCVYDFLKYRYGDKPKFKKITTDERMTEIFKINENDDPEKDGVCIPQLKKWCDVAGVSLYCLDSYNKIFHHYKPEKNSKQSPVVFRIKNNHFYPIINKGAVKTITERQKDKIICDKHAITHKKKEAIINDIHFMQTTATEEKMDAQTQFLITQIEQANKTPYPLENVTIYDGQIRDFKLNENLYICDTKENNQEIIDYCRDNDITYKGQSAVALLKKQLITTYGEQWTAQLNSGLNPHVRGLLSYENIKNRTHYGLINPTGDNKDRPLYGLMKVPDIVKMQKKKPLLLREFVKKHIKSIIENKYKLVLEFVKNHIKTTKDEYEQKTQFDADVKVLDYTKPKPKNDTAYKGVMCWDVKRSHSHAMNAPADEWLFYDFNDQVEKCEIDLYDGGQLENGLYYVKTADMSLLHGTNWYSASILNKMIKEGIVTAKNETLIKWRLVPSNNKKELTDSDGATIENKKIFTHLIKKITEDTAKYPALQKLMINSISGLMGKTEGKCLRVDIDTDQNRVLECIGERAETADLYIKNLTINNTKYYMYGKTERTFHSETPLPLYIQILDRNNMMLYDMVKEMGGDLIYRKTDCAICVNCDPKTKPQKDPKWGGWRESEMPEHYGDMTPANERGVPEPQEVKPWETLQYNDSDQADTIADNVGEGLMLTGRAGTGKTYVAKHIAEKTGAMKLAFTNKACLVLNGCTIHKFLSIDKNGNIDAKWLRKQTYKYYVVDEISMISSELWRLLCELKRMTRAKFILVGDYRQLPPVENGGHNYFNHPAIMWLCGSRRCELTTMKRYDKKLWDTSEKVYNDNNTPAEMVKRVTVEEMSKSHNISYTNRTRQEVNKAVNELMTKGKKYTLLEYADESDRYPQEARAYVGMPLIARKNGEDTANNEAFTVVEVDEGTITAVSTRDGQDNLVNITLEDFHKTFLMAYCVTCHKSQGDTIDGQIIVHDWGWMTKELKYTAITRTTKYEYVTIAK